MVTLLSSLVHEFSGGSAGVDVGLFQPNIFISVYETGMGMDIRHPALEVLFGGSDSVGVDVAQPSQREELEVLGKHRQHLLQEPTPLGSSVRVQEKCVGGSGVGQPPVQRGAVPDVLPVFYHEDAVGSS